MDVYALGVMLREMLTGGAPGPGGPGRAKVPPRLAAALNRAQASEPAERFATMDEFRAALLAGGEDERRAPPAHAPGRSNPRASARRLVAYARPACAGNPEGVDPPTRSGPSVGFTTG